MNDIDVISIPATATVNTYHAFAEDAFHFSKRSNHWVPRGSIGLDAASRKAVCDYNKNIFIVHVFTSVLTCCKCSGQDICLNVRA